MDDVRDDQQYNFMKSWHYINIDKGLPYPAKTEENAVTELTTAYLNLKHLQTLTPEQIKTAVLILFHLTGDLHQPLHAGYGSDRGGNSFDVSFKGNPTNLHSVWDGAIIEDQHITFSTVKGASPSFSKEMLKKIQAIDIVAWMNEGRALLPQVYGFTGNKIDNNYSVKNKAVIQKQLLYAGIRLAGLLDDVLKGSAGVQAPESIIIQDTLEPVAPDGTISAKDAAKYEGQEITVCTHVYSAKYMDKAAEGPTLINVGAPYPGSPLTIVIYKKDRSNFSYAPETFLPGKNICVFGIVKMYKGKPEIIVTRPDDLKLQ